MSPEPEKERKKKADNLSVPNILEMSQFQDTAQAPNRLTRRALLEVENGLPSDQIIELACLHLSRAGDFDAILKYSSIVAVLLRSDDESSSHAHDIVAGWSQHAVDPARWQLAQIFARAELPFDDAEVIEQGGLRPLCEGLFIEISRSAYSEESRSDHYGDGSQLVHIVRDILELGRPYEQHMLEALKISFYGEVILPEEGGQLSGEFLAFMIQDLGDDAALYLEDALVDSFSVVLPATFDPILSGYISGKALHSFHDAQSLPHYARENVLRRVVEQYTKSTDSRLRIRILSTLATYALEDPSLQDLFFEALDNSKNKSIAGESKMILQSLRAAGLHNSELAANLVKAPFIAHNCSNCAALDSDTQVLLAEVLEICGLAIHKSDSAVTRHFIQNAFNLALQSDCVNLSHPPFPQIFTALAVQDHGDFCAGMIDLLNKRDANERTAVVCATIISDVVVCGLDYLPSESINRLRSLFQAHLETPLSASKAIIKRSIEALDELQNYGI